MKIIGATVGTTIPKPSFDQTDPRKGDYIKGDRSFLNIDETLAHSGRPADAKATGDAINAIQAQLDEQIVQPDWNQNDETAPDYVKNRTHYAEGSGEILFNGSVEQSPKGGARTYLSNLIINDKTYTVIYDGVQYECTAYIDEGGYLCLGALYNFDIEDYDFSVFPFSISEESAGAGNTEYYCAMSVAGAHTLVIKDGFIQKLDAKYLPDTLATKEYVDEQDFAQKTEGTFYIEGSGTTDSTAKTSTWVGTSDRITAYYDGLAIRYKIGVAGQTTTTLNINGLGAKQVYRFGTTTLTTQFPVGSIINLVYHTDLNNGCWMCNDYDANTNTYQRVYATTTNAEYPITTRYATTTGSSYYAEYGRYSTGVTLNPSTNTITATKFKGALTGNADTATKATQDADGNVISSTYAKKSDIPDNIFIAEYGTTTYQEIWDAMEAGKTVLCNYTTGGDNSSVFSLVCCHLDEIRFNGDISDGRRQVVCKEDNTWMINSLPDIMTPWLGGEVEIELYKFKLFYYANPSLQLAIKGDLSDLPNGWTGFLTVYTTSPAGSITTSILEPTSENGFTFSDIGNMESYSMAMFKTGASTKLKWYLFKSHPAAEGASF